MVSWPGAGEGFDESPTYPANLCPLCGEAEFAGLREDFGQPVRKPFEAASRRAIRQRPSKHLHRVLGEEQGVNDTPKAGAGRNCWRFGLWNQMSGLRAGQMELALQIIQSDVDVPHRHLRIGMAE